MLKRKLKKSFTLVEMLIVVVIIGILAAALIPKLVGAQEKARDTARKGNLNNVNTYLTQYFGEIGIFTGTAGTTKDLKDIVNDLVPKYASSLPTDPMNSRTVKGLGTAAMVTSIGQYAYTPLTRNGAANAGMIIGADVESDGSNSNFVVDGTTTAITAIHGCDGECSLSQLGNGAVLAAGSPITDSRDLSRILCNTGVVLKPSAASSLQNCEGKTDPAILYVLVK